MLIAAASDQDHEFKSYFVDLGHRMWSDTDRFWVCIVVMVVITFFAINNADNTSRSAGRRVLGNAAELSAILAFPGLFALTWFLYNTFGTTSDSLLGPQAPIRGFSDYFHHGYIAALVIGIIAGAAILLRVKNWSRYPAAVGAFLSVTVITNLIVIISNAQ